MSEWWKDFISGSCAGLVSDLLLYPIDTANLREKTERKPPYRYQNGPFQTIRTIWLDEGIHGLFAGSKVTLLSAVPSTGIWFTTYEIMKKSGYNIFGTEHKPTVHLIHMSAGMLAELSCTLIEVPCEIVRSRHQLQGHPDLKYRLPYRYDGPFHAFKHIYKTEGFRGLFVGLHSSIALDCTYAGLQFVFYEYFKVSMQQYCQRQQLNTSEVLSIGGAAGATAAFITNPLDSITCRLQTQGSKVHYNGIIDCAYKVIQDQGILGLYKGSASRMLYYFPQAAVVWAVYESAQKLLKLYFPSRSYGNFSKNIHDNDDDDDND